MTTLPLEEHCTSDTIDAAVKALSEVLCSAADSGCCQYRGGLACWAKDHRAVALKVLEAGLAKHDADEEAGERSISQFSVQMNTGILKSICGDRTAGLRVGNLWLSVMERAGWKIRRDDVPDDDETDWLFDTETTCDGATVAAGLSRIAADAEAMARQVERHLDHVFETPEQRRKRLQSF